MTTEAPRSARKSVHEPDDLKLYLLSLLAGTYLIAGWAFGARTKASDPSREPMDAPAIEAQAPRATWYTDLPPSERPALSLPSGWTIASSPSTPAPSVDQGPLAPRRVLQVRPGRIRTRSS